MPLRTICRMAGFATLWLACSGTAYAEDCEQLLVPNLELVQRDVATDLAYLAFISAGNFQDHKKNANSELQPIRGRQMFQGNVHVGLDLPIAKQLLQSSASYAEFEHKRDEQYRQYHFTYALADLAKYYAQSLPEVRANQYLQCVRSQGVRVRVAKADKDFVELSIGWRPAAGESAAATIAQPVVTGAALQGSLPPQLKYPGDITLRYLRDLDSEFHFEVTAGGSATAVFIPRFSNPELFVDSATAQCASAAKVVHAVYRQVLERDIKPALLAHQAALLTNHVNSVRQLVEGLANGTEYNARFVQGKSDEQLLRGYYRHILARDFDAKGIAYNSNLLRTSGYAKVAIAFEESPEYRQRFGEWIVPGAPPLIKYCGNTKAPVSP